MNQTTTCPQCAGPHTLDHCPRWRMRDALIAAIHREESPGIIADLTARLAQLKGVVGQALGPHYDAPSEVVAAGSIGDDPEFRKRFSYMLFSEREDLAKWLDARDPAQEQAKPSDELIRAAVSSIYMMDFQEEPGGYEIAIARAVLALAAPTGASQSGRIREFECVITDLTAECKQLRAGLDEVVACFDAAKIEGLLEVLAETADDRLKDLFERRLMYGYYAAQVAYNGPSERAVAAGNRAIAQEERACRAEDVLLSLVEQISKTNPVDDLGHKTVLNAAYINALRLINDAGIAPRSLRNIISLVVGA